MGLEMYDIMRFLFVRICLFETTGFPGVSQCNLQLDDVMRFIGVYAMCLCRVCG